MNHNPNDVICWCEICEEYRREHYRKDYHSSQEITENEKMTWLIIGLVLVSIILIGGYIDTEYYKLTDIL